MIQMKRAYEPASKSDGFRVLVDRLWPRGLKKEKLSLDAWMKDLAPSTELRNEFGHEPKLWKNFQMKYTKELKSTAARENLKELGAIAKRRDVTLVFSAKDEEHNNAVVIKQVLEKEFLH